MLKRAGVSVRIFARQLAGVRLVRVAGRSMLPTFGPGAVLVTVPVRDATLRPNTIVTCADPRYPQRILVKRVVARLDDLVDVRGDNPQASADSQTFGLLATGAIKARVVCALTRGNRAG